MTANLGDLGWYERMAQRAQKRARDQAEHEAARRRAEDERGAAEHPIDARRLGSGPLGESEMIEEGRHRRHRVHGLGPYHGNSFWCSCGEFMGITTVAITEEMLTAERPDHCWICRERGIEHLTGP